MQKKPVKMTKIFHRGYCEPECCPVFDKFTDKVDCFVPEICQEIEELFSKHKKMFDRRPRLMKLAMPTHPICRYNRKCPCNLGNTIQIIRDQPVRLRTEQLAYPAVRKLVLFKTEYKHLLRPERILLLNRLIRLSLLSLYSHLQNIQPPPLPTRVEKWTPADWKIHKKYIRKLAMPKKPPTLPKEPKQWKELSAMKRFKKLAIPKVREDVSKGDWVLTSGAKNYEASDRIKKLAEAQIVDGDSMNLQLPLKVAPNALHYKASARIREMAQPAIRHSGESDLKENPFTISPNALKAKASARIEELAEPKEYENKHIRDNPQFISPAALKAVASPRIIELAKPRGS